MNISVIIPVYNAEKYIKKAIESCIQFPEVKEIVVVDDGYKDKAKEVVCGLMEKYPIIKLYEHPDNENRGAGPSRNLGIEKATQEYIAFLDADDFFLPNRFTKDIMVLAENPDADGCYNAIDCYFYSPAAEEYFKKHFHSTLTTINTSANPTPGNLFRGRIGMIPNFGHFSLDGLTVKRECLLKNKILFPPLPVHQDTVFILQLAHYAKLYPSQIIIPVASRGVHEENRITANNAQGRLKRYNNQFLMWNLIFQWARREKLENDILIYLENTTNFYRLLSNPSPKSTELLGVILKKPRILFNPYYPELHSAYFGDGLFSEMFLRIRNVIVLLLKKVLNKS